MFYRIIVPTDFSSCSEEAWRIAQCLAGMSGAELVLTHVLTEAPCSGRARSSCPRSSCPRCARS
jgi:nucleotide-binding universal stress UspA family protein